MNLIEVERLTKLYGDFVAVEDLTFTVREGEIIGLVGPNGAGKTTTLRSLGGIHPPSRGVVRICGHDIVSDAVPAKKNIAYMPDEPRLFDYLTVDEHLQFIARLYHVTDWKERATGLLTELDLLEKRAALPGELSRGMKQKLMIACGLIHDPRVLIFDEPLTGLDPLGIRRMKQTISRRSQEGAAIILSSHLLHLVEELCDRVLILRTGRTVAFGTIDSIKRQIAAGGADASLEEAFIRITSADASTPVAEVTASEVESK